jgi:Domain of unknown function (DUF4157)
MRKSDAVDPTAGEAPSVVHEALRSPGQPLDAATRAYFESHIRHDFSQVRVHADTQAAAAAESVRAHAFTVGQNVVFGAGRFAPASNDGRKLLAHELTHVVQQARSVTPVVQRDDKKDPAPPPSMKPAPASTAQQVPVNTISVVQLRWSKLKQAFAKFPELKAWIDKGDAVIALMLDHESAYYRAIQQGDAGLAAAYQVILESDLAAYRYVSWHVYFYARWLRLRERFDSLVQTSLASTSPKRKCA